MKTLHLLGHTPNWNLDAHYINNVGDGFVFTAYSFPYGFADNEKISKYKMQDVLSKSFLDLQFYGKKETVDIGKLSTYPFHTIQTPSNAVTNISIINSIKQAISHQVEIGLKNIIIPNYYENDDVDKLIGIIRQVNFDLSKKRDSTCRYFMTVPISRDTIIDEGKIEKLLFALTDREIVFDGYYIMCEARPETMHKVCIDYKYLGNLSRVFEVLKLQDFTIIYAYANWDALVFLATADIDYITIGTYENMRKFNINRFITRESGGPSKGWYYSEKLLNFIKSQELALIRQQRALDVIKNTKNIFSDIVLEQYYDWSNNKPDVHKNYLISIDRELKELAAITNIQERKAYMMNKIDNAIDNYNELGDLNVLLPSGSDNYHLSTWKSHLSRK